MKKAIISLTFAMMATLLIPAAGQTVALKTNALSWATTTVNAGVEVAVAHRHSVQVFGALNPWTFSGGRRARIWAAEPEWRYWFCETFNGHFAGVHALGGEYNVRNIDVPFGILPKTEKGRHYEGWYIGAGLTYGYQWMISHHWNFEASVGLGYAYSPYRLYGRCDRCLERKHRNYVGPTKAALSIIYIF